MKAKFRAVVGALLVSVACAGGAVMPVAGYAAQPGQICYTASEWGFQWVWAEAMGYTPLYDIGPGQGFRIVAYGANNTYYGRRNGKPEGYLSRDFIYQPSCQW